MVRRASEPNSKRRQAYARRLRETRVATVGSHQDSRPAPEGPEMRESATVDCGWGRVLFAQTFGDATTLCEAMRAEGPDRRDIAFYVRDPHVLLASAPQELFLDPSHTYRLTLTSYRATRLKHKGFFVRRMATREDAEDMNRIYSARGMVPIPPEFFWSRRNTRAVTVLVAEDEQTGALLGTVMGIDHTRAFADPERGSSLWSLAVDPQAPHARVGEALVRNLIEHFATRGAAYMDLSVLHDNEQAIKLYDKLGFRRVPLFAVKRKNPINEKLYIGSSLTEGLNPYAEIIVNEAMRRGITVEVTDTEAGFFRLTYGGRSIHCRESLSELTSAVAMSICDDKRLTRRMVERVGIRVPEELILQGDEEQDKGAVEDFLARHGSIVVKPARGEQGRGVAVGLATIEEAMTAIEAAREQSDSVLIEEMAKGQDLRIIVIDYKVVAAAVRRPPHIFGDGSSTIRTLIEHQSRRRAAATRGESRIPLDAECERCLRAQGLALDDVTEQGKEIKVRNTANLHTGGTIHDATDALHPALVTAAIKAARAIEIPVVGLDMLVPSPSGPDYAFIEANERPGLANHEPQPTAERFVDLLFPLSIPHAARLARHNAPQHEPS